MRSGCQSELLLLIADHQPVSRNDLMDRFDGDGRQCSNALYQLRNSDLINKSDSGYELTELGCNETKILSDKIVREQPKSTQTQAPVLIRLTPELKSGIDIDKKLEVLDTLQGIVCSDMSIVLRAIKEDLRKQI